MTPPAADQDESNPPAKRGPGYWMQAVFGLAIAGYGIWMLSDRGWKSPTGFLIVCVGVMIAPMLVTRLVGGLGALGLAVWLAVNAGGSFDYVYAALIGFVGGSSALDGLNSLKRKRAS